MGKAKKLRTMQATVSSIAKHEIDSFIARQQKKKFDVLVRSGMIVRGVGEDWVFDDFNWITT